MAAANNNNNNNNGQPKLSKKARKAQRKAEEEEARLAAGTGQFVYGNDAGVLHAPYNAWQGPPSSTEMAGIPMGVYPVQPPPPPSYAPPSPYPTAPMHYGGEATYTSHPAETTDFSPSAV